LSNEISVAIDGTVLQFSVLVNELPAVIKGIEDHSLDLDSIKSPVLGILLRTNVHGWLKDNGVGKPVSIAIATNQYFVAL
jgi:hypothetical protein